MEKYLSSPPRCGIWLNSNFRLKAMSILECAGGSCRDARYLHSLGLNAAGSDFDEKTLNFLKEKFKGSGFKVSKENAFSMNLDANSFDMVYHNGFWIYFSDEQIKELLKEQARVASKHLIALVHNGENKRLIDVFSKKARADSLYKIRFFTKEELCKIVGESGVIYKKITVKKFGGPVDNLYIILKWLPFMRPVVQWIVPRSYRFQSWKVVERVALILEL